MSSVWRIIAHVVLYNAIGGFALATAIWRYDTDENGKRRLLLDTLAEALEDWVYDADLRPIVVVVLLWTWPVWWPIAAVMTTCHHARTKSPQLFKQCREYGRKRLRQRKKQKAAVYKHDSSVGI